MASRSRSVDDNEACAIVRGQSERTDIERRAAIVGDLMDVAKEGLREQHGGLRHHPLGSTEPPRYGPQGWYRKDFHVIVV